VEQTFRLSSKEYEQTKGEFSEQGLGKDPKKGKH
jgi:hypothetical protein